MRMSIHYQWLLVLLIFLLVPATPKEHYHRYMLSDYRPQHNPRTQMDYKRHKAPVYPTDDSNKKLISNSMGPLIKIGDSGTTIPLQELLVRIYRDHKFYCMGIIITDLLIITASTCFMNLKPGNFTVKTFNNQLLEAFNSDYDAHFLKNQETLITVLAVPAPISLPNLKMDTFAVKLCELSLIPSTRVFLPTYIRWRHSVHTQATEVLAVRECRSRMHDPLGKVITNAMICVSNKKFTEDCQPTFGNPLVHDGRICGINVMGHNCPKRFGVDVYASVYNAEDFFKNRFEVVKKSKLENAIL